VGLREVSSHNTESLDFHRLPGGVVPGLRKSRGRTIARTVVSWVLRLTFFVILDIIVGTWVNGGGLTSLHDTAGVLTSAGRLTALLGTYALLIQLLLLARLPFLEMVVGFDKLTVFHRVNGRLALGLIVAHVGFVVEGYALTARSSFVGEFGAMLSGFYGMVAALVGTILLVMVVITSIVAVRRRLRYEVWYLIHLMAYLGIFLAWFHQVRTGTVFLSNPAATVFWTAIYVVTLQLLLLFRVAQPIVRGYWHRLRVAEVIDEGPGVVSLRITGHHLDWLDARSGQFFLWRFLAPGLWWESHPFSLSAVPDGQSLRITVKDLGDFSRGLRHVKPGTRVSAEGPFGSFTQSASTSNRLAMIAGGIGITPIRALLEEVEGDVVVIYRVAEPADVIFREELEHLAGAHGISLHYVLGHREESGNRDLLSEQHILELVPDIAERDVYLCGPRGMMRSVEESLDRLGVAEEQIHSDEFAF
jgi:predicted ferric reductase